jgi:hypothetical protein
MCFGRALHIGVGHMTRRHGHQTLFCIQNVSCTPVESVPQLEESFLSWCSSVGSQFFTVLSGIHVALSVILAIDVVSLWSFSCICRIRAHNRLAQTLFVPDEIEGWLDCLSPLLNFYDKRFWRVYTAK